MVTATEIEFKKNQSYELADLIKSFIPDQGKQDSILNWQINARKDNIYWSSGMKASTYDYNMYTWEISGVAGVLFNGKGMTVVKQEWINGQLVKSKEEIGECVDVGVHGPSSGPLIVNIFIMMSSPHIQNCITGVLPYSTFKFDDYMIAQGAKVKYLWQHGYSGSKETGWLVSYDKKQDVWIIVRESYGASGAVGYTSFSLVYSEEEAKRNSILADYQKYDSK
jgi:hypothetical protein